MKEKTHEVSVIIPCYNGERFISDAVESVLDQTRGDLELVVVDDASGDASVKILERYAKDPRVRVIRHDSNRGVAAARNTGITNAVGRFIGFLDQDDIWKENKLSLQLERFERDEKGEFGVVFSYVFDVCEGEGRFGRRGSNVPKNIEQLEPDELISRMLLANVVTIGTALVRKECFETVGLLDETIRSGSDDFELFTRLAARYRFTCVREPLLIRRLHGGNFAAADKMVPEVLRVIDRIISERPALRKIEGLVHSRRLYMLAREKHAQGNRAEAISGYKEAIRARRTNLKPLLALFLCRAGTAGDAVLLLLNRLRRALRF